MKRSFYAGAVAFVIILATSHLRSTPYANYVYLADAFWHGHTWIDWPGQFIDALQYNGQHYVIEAPLPALLLMPFEAIFGLATNQTSLAVVLGAVSIGAAWEMCERLTVSAVNTVWLCAFLLAGTDLLWCAMLGDVWFIAHVSAVCFTLLAMVELLGKKRGWLVALWAVCAAESRFSMLLAIPVYAYLLLQQPEENAQPNLAAAIRSRMISFGVVLAVGAGLWLAYNRARWGTFGDIGYVQWYHEDVVGLPEGSPFRWMYLPDQLWSFFVQFPQFSRSFPYVIPSQLGVALTWTSPALLLAFFARGPKRWVLAMWVAAFLTAAPNFLYYVNGFAQFGMRHALDFIPFLFVLMALAARNGLPVWSRVLIAYSVAVGLWGSWFWNVYIRSTT